MDRESNSERNILSASDLSLVIPVYNEADNIHPLFQAIENHLGSEIHILICYDFEEDNTLPALEPYKGKFSNLRLVKNQFGRGPLGAIKSGFDAATTSAVMVMMADLSDDLTSVAAMMKKFKEEDCAVVSASRYMKGGVQKGGPLLKRTLSRMAGLSLKCLTGIATHDPTNNFKLYSKDFLQKVTIESDGGFELALELTVKAHLMKQKIGEVPTKWEDRVAGESRFQLRKWLPKYLKWYFKAFKGR